ncbi:hypothetical protein SSCG_01985 [Streptomyces clavuligerus]|nr:hypothetical protein SSCG_01985 [Streptomyces clavuligerus]
MPPWRPEVPGGAGVPGGYGERRDARGVRGALRPGARGARGVPG